MQHNIQYIPDSLKQDENLQDKKAKIDRIAREASVKLAHTMADAVRTGIQHVWNQRIDSMIDEIVKIAKHVTCPIEKNKFTDDAWLGAPEGLIPLYCIVQFASEIDKDKNSNFLQNDIIQK
jgi:hypothetical protein